MSDVLGQAKEAIFRRVGGNPLQLFPDQIKALHEGMIELIRAFPLLSQNRLFRRSFMVVSSLQHALQSSKQSLLPN